MFLQRKVDRAMDWLKEKNKPTTELKEWEEVEFEKADKIAIVISGILVMAPVFIILILILYFFMKI